MNQKVISILLSVFFLMFLVIFSNGCCMHCHKGIEAIRHEKYDYSIVLQYKTFKAPFESSSYEQCEECRIRLIEFVLPRGLRYCYHKISGIPIKDISKKRIIPSYEIISRDVISEPSKRTEIHYSIKIMLEDIMEIYRE